MVTEVGLTPDLGFGTRQLHNVPSSVIVMNSPKERAFHRYRLK